MIITSYLLVSVYVTQLASTQAQLKPTMTHKLYTTQKECTDVKAIMQSKIKVGVSHTFCMKVKHSN